MDDTSIAQFFGALEQVLDSGLVPCYFQSLLKSLLIFGLDLYVVFEPRQGVRVITTFFITDQFRDAEDAHLKRIAHDLAEEDGVFGTATKKQCQGKLEDAFRNEEIDVQLGEIRREKRHPLLVFSETRFDQYLFGLVMVA